MEISQAKKEIIISKLQQDIEAANAYYESEIEPKIMERYQIYKSDKGFYNKMFPILSKRCTLATTDVHDTISSIMPSIMKTFFSSDDVITIAARDGSLEDEKRAEIMQELINYQFENGHFYMTAYQWFLDALITNLGILKLDWERTYKEQQTTDKIAMDQLQQFVAELEHNGGQMLEMEPSEIDGTAVVTYVTKVIDKNRPRFANVSAAEFRVDPAATSIEDADFVAHRKIVTIDYLRKKALNDIYDKTAVEKVAESAEQPHFTHLDQHNNHNIDEANNNVDSGRRKIELYECYVRLNASDDKNAVLQDMIVTLAGDQILRMERNTYERAPFFLISPFPQPHKIWPELGIVDLLSPEQHTKTAILRQMIYNLAQNNDSRMAVDVTQLVDVNDLLKDNRYIRVRGEAQKAVQPLVSTPLQPWSFDMLSYLDQQRENKSGITRYNQGLDGQGLNKTATGINLIQQAANQRLELICRTLAETGMRDLMRHVIKLNQLFINQPLVIRLANQPLQIDPEDLDGEFDLLVDAGMGTSTKQEKIQALQMLEPLIEKMAQVGMAGPKQFRNAFEKFSTNLGFKDASQFLMSEEEMEQQQQAAQEQQQPQEPPKVSVNYDQLPWQAQMLMLQSYGLPAEPSWFVEKVQQDAMREAVSAHAKADANRAPEHAWGDAAQALALKQGQPQPTGGNL